MYFPFSRLQATIRRVTSLRSVRDTPCIKSLTVCCVLRSINPAIRLKRNVMYFRSCRLMANQMARPMPPHPTRALTIGEELSPSLSTWEYRYVAYSGENWSCIPIIMFTTITTSPTISRPRVANLFCVGIAIRFFAKEKTSFGSINSLVLLLTRGFLSETDGRFFSVEVSFRISLSLMVSLP